MRLAFATILYTFVLSLASSRLSAREVVKVTKNSGIETQITKPGVDYIIRSTFDLNGGRLVMPADCILKFEKKGRLQNGILIGNNTEICSKKRRILGNLKIEGTFKSNRALPEWFDGDDNSKIAKAIQIADTVAIDKEYKISQTVHIVKPIVLVGSGLIALCETLPVGISIHSSDVSMEGVSLKTTSEKADLFQAIGSKESTLKKLKIMACSFNGGMNAIRWDYVEESLVERNIISNVDYTGIGIYSCQNIDVAFNHISDVNVKHNNQNSYGVAATFHYGHPKSKNIRITDNTVENNPYWEALDTHGGENIEFSRNIVRNSWRGVAAVSDNHRDPVLCSNVVITDNEIECSSEPYSNGIVFTGLADDSLAKGWTISGNVIKNAVIGFYSNFTSAAEVKNNEATVVDEGWRDRGSVSLSFASNTIHVVGKGDSQYRRCGLYLIPSQGSKYSFGEIRNNHIIANDNEGVIAREAFKSHILLIDNIIETKGVKYKGGEDNQIQTLRMHYFTEIKDKDIK